MDGEEGGGKWGVMWCGMERAVGEVWTRGAGCGEKDGTGMGWGDGEGGMRVRVSLWTYGHVDLKLEL